MVDIYRSAYFQNLEDDAGGVGGKRKGTLLGYFTSLSCPVCEERTQSGLCEACRTDKQRVAVISSCRIHRAQRSHSQLAQVYTKARFPLPELTARQLG